MRSHPTSYYLLEAEDDDELWKRQRRWERGRMIVRGKDLHGVTLKDIATHLRLSNARVQQLYHKYRHQNVSPLERYLAQSNLEHLSKM